MSHEAVNWTWTESQASGSELLVLLRIAHQINDDGFTWGSIPKIAKRAKVSKATAYRAIGSLVELGELRVFRRPNRSPAFIMPLVPDYDEGAARRELTARHPDDRFTEWRPESQNETPGESEGRKLAVSESQNETPQVSQDETPVSHSYETPVSHGRDTRCRTGETQYDPLYDHGMTPVSGDHGSLFEGEAFDDGSSKQERPRDLLWDTLIELMGYEPTTPNERGRWNRFLKVVRDAGCGPEDIAARWVLYLQNFEGAPLTVAGLMNQWDWLGGRLANMSPTQIDAARKQITQRSWDDEFVQAAETAHRAAARGLTEGNDT